MVSVQVQTVFGAFDYREQPISFWKGVLKPEVFHICREKGTERAGSGRYDSFYEDGLYYCACCGGDYPLFDSKTKYHSKTGWPSFWQPIDLTHIRAVKEQRWWFGPVVEVRCGRCDSHLGDIFDDGPEPTGKRYCINSLALVFVPRSQKPVRTYAEPKVQ
ncbi:MAG: peptide-methionine (R)-S-oxide reductase MsrB [Pseudomonadota bacterium]